MNATLIDNQSNSDDESENYNPNEGVNYMTFTSVVKSEPVEEIEMLEDLEQFDSSKEDD